MSKVGRFVNDPKAGIYCQIRLDSGDKLLVNHERAGLDTGRLTVELSKWLGLGSERLFTLDLDSAQGRAGFRRLTEIVPASAQNTPLEALVDYIKEGRDADDVRRRCEALVPKVRAA